MSTPVLNLPADCLTSPTLVHVAEVAAMMLWPDDQRSRDYFFIATVLHSVPLVERNNHYLALALQITPPPGSLELRVRLSQVHGAQAGAYFYETVAASALGLSFSMKEFRGTLADGFKGVSGSSEKDRDFEKRIWPVYRPVAHLWAAFLHRSDIGTGRPFPCAVDDFADFIRLASGFRELGEETKINGKGLNGQTRRLLQPGEAVAFPQALPIRVTLPIFPGADNDYSRAVGNS